MQRQTWPEGRRRGHLAVERPTYSPSVIQKALRLMLVAITQETEQIHFSNLQFFTFVADSCPSASQHCVHEVIHAWSNTLTSFNTHYLYSCRWPMYYMQRQSEAFIRGLFGVVLCRAVIPPPLLLKLPSLSWNHDSCVLQMCWWATILHLASTWKSQFIIWILLQFTSCKVFFFFLQVLVFISP